MPTLFRSLWTALALTVLAAFAFAPAFAQDGSYKIQPGDTLQMDVLEDASLSRPLLVLPDGSISVPSGGVVRAAGLTLPQVQDAVTAALAPNFAKTPTVYLSVGQLNPDAPKAGAGGAAAGTTVYLMGEVAKPGTIAVPKGTTLLQFLAETGGLTPYAATKRIQIRRTVNGEEKLWIFNYAAVMAGGPAPAITLQKGDVIIVPQRRLFE